MDNTQLSLRALYQQHASKVSAKWSSYLTRYEEFFAPYRDKPIRLLELGVQNGGSLEIWSKYFANATLFVGCDIDPLCEQLAYEDSRVKLIIGDINTPQAYSEVTSFSNQYDIIIDDASHRSGDIINAFVSLFPLLEDDGLYVIEDLHCSYWQGYDGGLYDPHSAITFLKQCADVINHEHWGLPLKRSAVFDQGLTQKYEVALDEIVLSQIKSITFYNSVCVIKKGDPALGQLIVSGQEEKVSQGNLDLNGRLSQPLSQVDNLWSQRKHLDDKDIIALTQDLQESKAALAYEKEVSAQKQDFMEKTCEQFAKEAAEHTQLKAKFVEVMNKNQNLEAENAKLLSSLETVNASFSWKITKPLRGLKRFIDRLVKDRNQ